MRLGGTTDVLGCSFLSNSASARGPAIAVVASTNISGCSFDKNEMHCAAGSYRHGSEEVSRNSKLTWTLGPVRLR